MQLEARVIISGIRSGHRSLCVYWLHKSARLLPLTAVSILLPETTAHSAQRSLGTYKSVCVYVI